MNGREWIASFAADLGVDPPDDATIDTLLEIAGTAAHGSERIAAPIACFLIGRANISLEQAHDVARRIADASPRGKPPAR
jgi:hypothetical protein